MTLVPFNQQWADSGSKLDLHGIYERGETICALPVRRHNDWVSKGFRYVTLATRSDAGSVKDSLRMQGVDLASLDAAYERTAAGAFKVSEYLAGTPAREEAEVEKLEARLTQIKKPKAEPKAHDKAKV